MIKVLRGLSRYALAQPCQGSSTRKVGRADDFISAAKVNTYLNKFNGFMSWAVKEEIVDRNPAALRIADTTHKRDKRSPFSVAQLRLILNAPLYVGCLDDERGYASLANSRLRNARFWLPLIAYFRAFEQGPKHGQVLHHRGAAGVGRRTVRHNSRRDGA